MLLLLRKVSLAEGVSFLVLVGIAMPLKYALGMPLAVKVAGWVHGALFIALSALLVRAYGDDKLDGKLATAVWVAALLPFGPFFMDTKLKTAEAEAREA